MAGLEGRLRALDAGALKGMRRGIEKESLRTRPDGALALTPHAAALGSALAHPHVTTDFSESQLELIRNFRRHGWLLLYLFGASPAVCSSFVAGRAHRSRSSARAPHLPTPRRCAWGGWATRATRSPRSR